MLRLDVDLAELLSGLLEVLLGLLKLLLQQLNLASEVLTGSLVGVCLLVHTLEVAELLLGLLKVLLCQPNLVLQAGDLLVTLEKSLVELVSETPSVR